MRFPANRWCSVCGTASLVASWATPGLLCVEGDRAILYSPPRHRPGEDHPNHYTEKIPASPDFRHRRFFWPFFRLFSPSYLFASSQCVRGKGPTDPL